MTTKDSLRSPLANVRGLGSAKDGTGHWWWQRVTALALIPLSIWFIYGLITVIAGGDRAAITQWIHNPVTAIALSLFVVALFIHSKLGVQVVIEDYIHSHGLRLTLLIINQFASYLLMAVALLSIIKIHIS